MKLPGELSKVVRHKACWLNVRMYIGQMYKIRKIHRLDADLPKFLLVSWNTLRHINYDPDQQRYLFHYQNVPCGGGIT